MSKHDPEQTPPSEHDEDDEAADDADDDSDDADDDADADDDSDDADDDSDDADDDSDDADDDSDDADDDDAEDDGPPAASRPWREVVVPTLWFVLSVAFLDVLVNVRYPLDEPRLWYLIPSTDISVVLLNFAIMGLLTTPVPRWMHRLVLVWLFLARFMRFGDGVKGRYFAQRFNLYSDLPLIADGARFLNSTWPFWQLLLGGILAIAAIVGAVFLAQRALGVTQRYLSDRRQVLVGFVLIVVSYAVVASLPKNARYESYFAGGFAASIMPRLEEEVVFLWNVKSQEGEYATLIQQTEQMLAGLPSDLAKLRGANVYLILVESYGRACFEWPPLAKITKDSFDAFERDVKAQGFSVATGVLNSSTYGGQSWLAHNTLDTGIATHTQLEYEIVYARRPTPLATYFNRAGYRSVLVQPNTTRVASGDFYDFRQKYYNADFHYRGPAYAWATMPDQYVLDFVRRRELEHKTQPLFIQYVLVSSHAPWSKLPTLVDDWDALGDGRVFSRTPMLRFPIEWPHFENATEAYGKSIVYDFELLRRYITRFIDDGSLVVILGDHQPVAEVNGDSWEFGVPIHVLSKNPDLVRPFMNRGYQPGMRPNFGGYTQGLETFLPNFLVDFSTERAVNPPSK